MLPLRGLILSPSAGDHLQPQSSSPHASFLPCLTTREEAHPPSPALPPPRNPPPGTRPAAGLHLHELGHAPLVGLHLHELASPPSTQVASATSSSPSPLLSPSMALSAGCKDHGHCCRPMIPTVPADATVGSGRCCRPMLPSAAVLADVRIFRCCQRRLVLLPAGGARRCCQRHPLLLQMSAVGATNSSRRRYISVSSMLQTLAAVDT